MVKISIINITLKLSSMTSLKTGLIVKVLLIALIVLLQSCFPEDNHGYTKKVTFAKAGGVIVLNGEESYMTFDIRDDQYNYVLSNEQIKDGEFVDSISAHMQWLTVKKKVLEPKLIIIADSFEDDKDRELKIHLSFGSSWGEIKVKQKA